MAAEFMSSREMRVLELNSEYFGVQRLLLMENAGQHVASEITSRFKPDKLVAVFCGLGGNGGDGFVVARHLSSLGFRVTVVVAGRGEDVSDRAAIENWKALQSLWKTVTIYEVCDSTVMPDVEADVVVDALLGTGAKGKLRPPILQLVKKMNSMKAFRVAVDVPTGIDADTGEVLGRAVKADLTVTFHKTKKGLTKAEKYAGEVVVKGIGLPREFEKYAGPGDILAVNMPRPSTAHKGDFGRLLVVGGSKTFSGAPALVALAALRSGVDLAYVAAPEKTAYALSSMSPDLITVKMDGDCFNVGNVRGLRKYIEKCDALAVGPGLDLHKDTQEAVEALIEAAEKAGKPLLLDADGLKAFAKFKRKLRVPLVLTPHAGEYAILTGQKPSQSLSEKASGAMKTAAKLGATLLLKGPVDIVSDGNRLKLNFTGNPGMTVGGTGDVLSGIVGALLSQKVDAFESAVCGAFVNGAAGDYVFEQKGAHMVASDLLEWIPHVLNNPMDHARLQSWRAKTS